MPSRKNEICFKDFDEALAKSPETYGHIDVLCAGWPCQDNSIAGSRKGHAGEKSGLWVHVARCLRLFNPCWFIGENVPGFLSVSDGKDFCSVIAELQEIGYGVSWRILDSQYFGVAQRRRRLFIVGYFGSPCPPEILFEQESGCWDDSPNEEWKSIRGLCLLSGDQRNEATRENYVASTIRANDYNCGHKGYEKSNIVAKTLLTEESKLRKISSDGGNIIGHTLGAGKRGVAGRIWEETHIATSNSERKRETTGISDELVSPRGRVIGNAVTVNVAEWLGKRIMEFERLKNEVHCK